MGEERVHGWLDPVAGEESLWHGTLVLLKALWAEAHGNHHFVLWLKGESEALAWFKPAKIC